MWVFTMDGFYSAVQHHGGANWLIVRSRTEGDAKRLADWLTNNGETYSEVEHTPKADYGWRINVRKDDFARYVAASVEAIDYPNFKEAVLNRYGYSRSHVYGEVWAALLDLQHGPTVEP